MSILFYDVFPFLCPRVRDGIVKGCCPRLYLGQDTGRSQALGNNNTPHISECVLPPVWCLLHWPRPANQRGGGGCLRNSCLVAGGRLPLSGGGSGLFFTDPYIVSCHISVSCETNITQSTPSGYFASQQLHKVTKASLTLNFSICIL